MELLEYKKHRWTLSKRKNKLGYGCIDCGLFISQEEHRELRKSEVH